MDRKNCWTVDDRCFSSYREMAVGRSTPKNITSTRSLLNFSTSENVKNTCNSIELDLNDLIITVTSGYRIVFRCKSVTLAEKTSDERLLVATPVGRDKLNRSLLTAVQHTAAQILNRNRMIAIRTLCVQALQYSVSNHRNVI